MNENENTPRRVRVDIVERLAIEARNARNPPIEFLADENGHRVALRPAPDADMADLLDAAIAEIVVLRHRRPLAAETADEPLRMIDRLLWPQGEHMATLHRQAAATIEKLYRQLRGAA